MPNGRRPAIPLQRAAICLDDLVIFDSLDRSCPACGSEKAVGWWTFSGTGKAMNGSAPEPQRPEAERKGEPA